MGHLQGRTGREERDKSEPAEADSEADRRTRKRKVARSYLRALFQPHHTRKPPRGHKKQHVNQRAGQRLREKTGLIENQALPSTRPLLQLLPPAPKSARPPLVSADEQTSNAKKTKSLTTPGCSLPVRPLVASPQRGRERERVPEPRQRRRRVRPWRAFLSGPSLRSPQL